MAGEMQPLGNQFPIVTSQGTPTDYFIKWAQQRQIDIGAGITAAQAQQLIDDWSAQRDVAAGIGLSGGGSLENDIVLNLDASLNNLTDVDTTSSPPTDGDSLTFDSASSLWIPGPGGGGGGGFGGYCFATNPNTTVSSSANATKGRRISPFIGVTTVAFFPILTEVIGATYRLTVAELSGGDTISEVVGAATWLGTSTEPSKMVEVPLAVSLAAGKTYGILVTRTDLTGAYALPLSGAASGVSSVGGLPSASTLNSLIAPTNNPTVGTTFSVSTFPFTGDFLFTL